MNGTEQFSLAGKIIVITGGTGVLGAAFSLAVAKAGAKVAILGRNQERAHERVTAILEAGGEAMAVLADVLDESQMEKAKDQILAAWGTIDGLVNGAGGNMPGATVAPDQDVFSFSVEDTRRAVELNLFGTIIPSKVFGRVMAEKGRGTIVNISSLAAQRPLTRVLGYSMGKKAVESFTQWMAVELGQRYAGKLRMNALVPGVLLTEQNRDLLVKQDGSLTERAEKFIANTPYGRFSDPEELTGTLVYLLSDASGFVNGATLVVDGGFNVFSGV